jgi:hypothetical protein
MSIPPLGSAIHHVHWHGTGTSPTLHLHFTVTQVILDIQEEMQNPPNVFYKVFLD